MAQRRTTHINIKEVGKMAGVSIATVSRVLNNKQGVSEPIRNEVMKILRKHNYVPKQAGSRSNVIGVSLEWERSFDSFYLSRMMNAIEDSAYEAGYDILLLRNERLRSEKGYLDLYLRNKMLAGILILIANKSDEFPAQIARSGFPHLVIGSQCEGRVNYIDGDSYSGAYQATEHLINLGHKRICMLHHSLTRNYDHVERVRGYTDALNNSGVGFDPKLLIEIFHYRDSSFGYEDINTMLGCHPDVTAVLIPSNAAPGTMRSLKEHDLSAPEDISVIAFDDIPHDLVDILPVSIVSQDVEEMGELAIHHLLKQIESGDINSQEPVQMVRPNRLIIRRTTGRAPEQATKG